MGKHLVTDDSRARLPYLALLVSHRAPLARGEDALLGGLGLVAEDLLDELGVGADALEEHEVCAEGLLRSVRVLDIALARLSCLALSSSVSILALDIVGSESAHVGGVLALPRLFGGLRTALVGLEQGG